jgi:hypothetical protein
VLKALRELAPNLAGNSSTRPHSLSAHSRWCRYGYQDCCYREPQKKDSQSGIYELLHAHGRTPGITDTRAPIFRARACDHSMSNWKGHCDARHYVAALGGVGVAHCRRGELHAAGDEQFIRTDEESVDPLLCEARKGGVDLVIGASGEDFDLPPNGHGCRL